MPGPPSDRRLGCAHGPHAVRLELQNVDVGCPVEPVRPNLLEREAFDPRMHQVVRRDELVVRVRRRCPSQVGVRSVQRRSRPQPRNFTSSSGRVAATMAPWWRLTSVAVITGKCGASIGVPASMPNKQQGNNTSSTLLLNLLTRRGRAASASAKIEHVPRRYARRPWRW
jgi:hypothetical protein